MSKAKAINVTSASVSGVQVILDSINKLDEIRGLYVKTEAKTGEVQKLYALQMCDTFGAGWWEAKGEIKKAVKVEHQKFIADFEAIGKTRANIDQMWSRIKDESGRTKVPANKASGEGDAGVDSKTISELKTIYNRITDSTEDVSPLSYKIKMQLEEILDQLGVEI
jgi:hypothetical protein